MNGHDSTRFDRENSAEPIAEPPADVEDLSAEERAALAERLDRLAEAVYCGLSELSDVVEEGETPETERSQSVRTDLDLADETVRRHLTDVDGPDLSREERDPRTRSLSGGDLDDAEELRQAPAEEVAHRLASDVHDLRDIADRVDRKLYTEDLTDHEAEELWQAGARIAAWGRDVLVLRSDRDVLLTREEAEAIEARNAGPNGEGDHA